MLWLPDQERERIGAWARDDSPRESCGVLIGRPQGGGAVVVRAERARNLERSEPERRYELDPGDWVAAERTARAEGLAVVGIWHSHPRGRAVPSAVDLAGAHAGYAYLVVGLDATGELEYGCWRLCGARFEREPIGESLHEARA